MAVEVWLLLEELAIKKVQKLSVLFNLFLLNQMDLYSLIKLDTNFLL